MDHYDDRVIEQTQEEHGEMALALDDIEAFGERFKW